MRACGTYSEDGDRKILSVGDVVHAQIEETDFVVLAGLLSGHR